MLIAFGSFIYTAGVIIVCVRLCRREKPDLSINADLPINSNPLLGRSIADKCITDRCITDRCITDRCINDRCITDRCITDPTYSDIYRAKM